jgi:hypothetical protein
VTASRSQIVRETCTAQPNSGKKSARAAAMKANIDLRPSPDSRKESAVMLSEPTVAEIAPQRTVRRVASLPRPLIRREGIGWTGGVGEAPLRLELTFENPAPLPSAPATASVEVAAFGAFVPWRPLARIAVPAIPPRGRRIVTATLSADTGGGEPVAPTIAPAAWGWLQLQSKLKSGTAVHFVGNLNVFVSRHQPVERHVQRAIGLRPGCENFALFCLGDGKPDTYTFSIGSIESGWDATLLVHRWDAPLTTGLASIPLSIRPPEWAGSGGISILVRRESTAQTVPIEFELEAGVSGSKCYVF